MPKEVAAANHNADVSVNALAVGLLDGTFSVTSVDKFVSPERDARRRAVISYWLLVNGFRAFFSE
jgi:hypothetical protein